MQKWEEKFAFAPPKPTSHKVGGNNFNFYPVSVQCLLALKDVAKPVSQALAVLFKNKDNDNGTVHRKIASEIKGEFDEEMISDAIKPDVLKVRMESEHQAIGNIFDTLGKAETLDVVGRLLIDSLRDIFPPDANDNPPPREFMQSKTVMQSNHLYDFLVGVAKANKGMFGPLGERVGLAIETVSNALDQKMAKIKSGEADSTQKQGGENSKTASPGSSSGATNAVGCSPLG